MIQPASHEAFRTAMRSTASGVSVIATDGPAGRGGITVSTLQSLSLEPPSVMMCILATSRVLSMLERNRAFSANVLAAGQSEVAALFASGTAEARAAHFASPAWQAMPGGGLALAGALCVLGCTLSDIFDYASHRIVVGAVTAIGTHNAEPLIYSGRAYRNLRGLVEY